MNAPSPVDDVPLVDRARALVVELRASFPRDARLPGSVGAADTIEHDARLIEDLAAELERHQAWVVDLQAGTYVNCVYCGHRYGPGETTPVSMADALKAHVERCPSHPMSKLRAAHERALEALASVARQCGNVIFNCRQKAADNDRHLASWASVLTYVESALKAHGREPPRDDAESYRLQGVWR